MRTLNRNKLQLWFVNKTGEVDEIDGDGNFTGEKISTYGNPTEFYMSLNPFTDDITEEQFGKSENFDYIGISNNVVLTKDSLIFTSVPVEPYHDNYNYSVNAIGETLNTYRYGFKVRE